MLIAKTEKCILSVFAEGSDPMGVPVEEPNAIDLTHADGRSEHARRNAGSDQRSSLHSTSNKAFDIVLGAGKGAGLKAWWRTAVTTRS